MNKLLIIRGLPGSGKSTLAKEFVKLGYCHFEADMFFCLNENNEYNFEAEKLSLAHEWCYNSVAQALANGLNVVVSNTFSRLWELERYRKFNVDIQIVECQGRFNSIHNVPEYVIEKMRNRWEAII